MYTRTRRQYQKDATKRMNCGGAYVPPSAPIPNIQPSAPLPPKSQKFMRRAYSSDMTHPHTGTPAIVYEINDGTHPALYVMLKCPIVVTEEDGTITEFQELPDYFEEALETKLKQICKRDGKLSPGAIPDINDLLAEVFRERRDAEIECGVLGVEMQVPIP